MIKKAIISPFQKFVRIEGFSGMLLFAAAVMALILANTAWGVRIESFWQFKLGISTSGFELVKPLILWVNDGLMAIFFFLIGLEIKRELLIGELNTFKKASFPFFAAIGGMTVPVMFFLLLNHREDASQAWGIPMATDIAFSLAVLRLLGSRIPMGLKVFLTAFAIIDDLGAVLVIALFYSGAIKWGLIGLALLMLLVLFFLAYHKIYVKLLTFGLGTVIWVLFLKAGIHPTLAGILLALTIPVRQKIDFATHIQKLDGIVANIKKTGDRPGPLLTKDQIEEIDNLEDWTEKVQSPLQHLEHKLHNWVAYLIMPLFAFSNSGVRLGVGAGLDTQFSLVIMICLLAGNLVGITAFSWIGVKSGLAELPSGTNFTQILGISLLAGIGFTMSTFIANLAFTDHPGMLDSAKLGILTGSLIAGVFGYLVLRFSRKNIEMDAPGA